MHPKKTHTNTARTCKLHPQSTHNTDFSYYYIPLLFSVLLFFTAIILHKQPLIAWEVFYCRRRISIFFSPSGLLWMSLLREAFLVTEQKCLCGQAIMSSSFQPHVKWLVIAVFDTIDKHIGEKCCNTTTPTKRFNFDMLYLGSHMWGVMKNLRPLSLQAQTVTRQPWHIKLSVSKQQSINDFNFTGIIIRLHVSQTRLSLWSHERRWQAQ